MLNRAILMGRLAADPELRTTPGGVSVTSFRIAVARTYDREITDWIDIVAWRQTAEFACKYFHKGDPIIVEGAIQTRNYEDKNGYKRTATEVVASQLHFAGNRREQPSAGRLDIDPDEYEELDDGRDLPWE